MNDVLWTVWMSYEGRRFLLNTNNGLLYFFYLTLFQIVVDYAIPWDTFHWFVYRKWPLSHLPKSFVSVLCWDTALLLNKTAFAFFIGLATKMSWTETVAAIILMTWPLIYNLGIIVTRKRSNWHLNKLSEKSKSETQLSFKKNTTSTQCSLQLISHVDQTLQKRATWVWAWNQAPVCVPRVGICHPCTMWSDLLSGFCFSSSYTINLTALWGHLLVVQFEVLLVRCLLPWVSRSHDPQCSFTE